MFYGGKTRPQLRSLGFEVGHFASEGGLTDGPLLFPGWPGILDESCWRTARLWSLMSEPVVSPEGFTAGPLLLPGLPGIPAPEFWPPLGAVTWPPPEGAVVCAEAGSATIASAVAPMSNLNMANSLLMSRNQKPAGSMLYKRFYTPLRSGRRSLRTCGQNLPWASTSNRPHSIPRSSGTRRRFREGGRR